MQISYGATELCGGENEQPSGFKLSARRSVQEVEPMEAEGITAEGRANKRTTISFSVTKQHASYDAAETFALTHEDSLPDNDDLVVLNEGDAGSTYTHAALAGCDVEYLGVTTTATYIFLCGAPTATPAP